jgi:hypothetical protein
VTATVVIKRGRTLRANDAQAVPVQPTVLVELAETARLESGGAAVVIDVTVACPAGTTGLPSSLVVSQAGRAIGSGTYVPICDGSRHTFTARVEASQGLYEAGSRRHSRLPTSSTQARTSTASTTTARSAS